VLHTICLRCKCSVKDDPISQFRLNSADHLRVGQLIAMLGFKTLFVMESGCAVAKIGVNAVNVLFGFTNG